MKGETLIMKQHTSLSAAVDCDQAKQALMVAETDEDLEVAMKKARVLCED